MYSTMKAWLIAGSVHRTSTNIEDLHRSLNDMLSLLIQLCWDVDRYLTHNPC